MLCGGYPWKMTPPDDVLRTFYMSIVSTKEFHNTKTRLRIFDGQRFHVWSCSMWPHHCCWFDFVFWVFAMLCLRPMMTLSRHQQRALNFARRFVTHKKKSCDCALIIMFCLLFRSILIEFINKNWCNEAESMLEFTIRNYRNSSLNRFVNLLFAINWIRIGMKKAMQPIWWW